MDTIYDTLAKLNKVENAPEVVKEDSNALLKKGLKDFISKGRDKSGYDKAAADASKMNQMYKPFGKGDKDYEDGLSKDAKKDKMFDDMAAADASKMNKQKNYTPFSDKQSPDGLPEKKKDNKMFEKESDVERDDRAEKAGREVKRDAKYDGRDHAGKDGKDVTKDIEYDEKHDKDGMHEADINEISNKTIDSYMDKVGQEDGHEQDMETASSKREKGIDLATAKQLGNAKVKATENAGTLKDAARQGVMARLAELAGIPAQEIEEALGTPQDIADKIMHENPIDEAEVEEGNEFSGERDKAIKAGKNDFTVDGKTYPVKGDKNESLEESDIDQIADVGKVYSKINKMKMDLVDDGMEPEDAQDKACEKYDCDPAMYDKYVEMKRDEREGSKNESLEEADDDNMPSMKEMQGCVDKGMTEAEICEKYSDCDKGKIKLMAAKCGKMNEAEELDEGAVKDMMQDVEEGMDKAEFEKKYPGQDYDSIKKDIEDRMDETTSSGSVATGDSAGKPLYSAPSIYENNEIVKRAMQLNEDMSVTVSAGTDAEPNININASGEDAAKMAELCKLAGIGMMGMGSQPQSPYGEVEIQVAEDQEFANSADDQNTMDTDYMTKDIAGGLNGQKKMAYPKVAGGDNPMAVLGESEINETSADQLMKQYEAFKTK